MHYYILCNKYFIRQSKMKLIWSYCFTYPIRFQCSFLYLPKTSEKVTVFWCFQGAEKGCIGNKEVMGYGNAEAKANQVASRWVVSTFLYGASLGFESLQHLRWRAIYGIDYRLEAVNSYQEELHRRCCSDPSSASAITPNLVINYNHLLNFSS